MDELANVRNAPPQLLALEERLLESADLVFTGGYSLYEAKRSRHPNIHTFPSSDDVAHFAKARAAIADPAEQVGWPKPRLGFYGVIGERRDVDLVARLDDERPHWAIVLVGAGGKMDPATIPPPQKNTR